MDYRKLGNSGLKVSEVGLGGNNFGWWADETTSAAVISRALDLGVNFIDTADVYDTGRSEEFTGVALKGKRDRVIIATKFAGPMGNGANDRGGSRSYIIRAAEASLRRLQTDYIDLYQMHIPDPATPIAETLRALNDLVQAGKVRYVGCCNFAAWQVSEAFWTSRSAHLEPFITVQVGYHLLRRQIENELVPFCCAHGLGIIPWGPLAGGFLTGKYRKGEPRPEDARLAKTVPLYEPMFSEENWGKLADLESFCRERGHTVAELAIAWLLKRPCVSSVIAGATKPEQVSANVASAGWKLTAEEVALVDKLTA